MALDIKDRVPTKPNRFLFTPEDGSSPFYAVLSRADEPTQEGTPINKELLDSMIQAENTVVSDTVAEQYGLDEYTKDVDHALQTVPNIVPQYTTLLDVTLPEIALNTVVSFDLLHPTKDFDEIIGIMSIGAGTSTTSSDDVYVYSSFYDSSFSAFDSYNDFYTMQFIVAQGRQMYETYNKRGTAISTLYKPFDENHNVHVRKEQYKTYEPYSITDNCKGKHVFNDVCKIFIKPTSYRTLNDGRLKILGVKYHEK